MSRHERHLHGVTPEVAVSASRAVTPAEIRVFRPLMGLRILPALVTGRRPRIDLLRPLLDPAARAGFAVVADEPDRVILVHAGRYWRPSGDLHRTFETLAEFERFDDPGHAKLVAGFWAEPTDSGCLLVTETRVAGTDAAATKAFGRYWAIIGRPSGWIRTSWLRAAERRAAGQR